jgi:hypothetical protein
MSGVIRTRQSLIITQNQSEIIIMEYVSSLSTLIPGTTPHAPSQNGADQSIGPRVWSAGKNVDAFTEEGHRGGAPELPRF